MARGSEKKRRQEIVRAIRRQQRMEEEATMPLTAQEVEALFDFVEREFKSSGCDGTMRATLIFLDAHSVPEEVYEEVVVWLVEHGGGCDCEVIGNVREWWETPPL